MTVVPFGITNGKSLYVSRNDDELVRVSSTMGSKDPSVDSMMARHEFVGPPVFCSA